MTKPTPRPSGTPVAERSGDGTSVENAASGGRTGDTRSARPMKDRLQEKLAQAKQEARRNAQPTTPPPGGKGPRRARLRLTRIDPWSVMKMAFLLSIALGVVTIVAVAVVWGVLGAAGVWDSVNSSVQDIVGPESGGWNVEDYLGTSRVLGFTMIVSVVDVVLLTAVATLGAFLYNMAAALLGGVEVTLTEDH